MNTTFEYGEIADKEFRPIPLLREQFEKEWPKHQIWINQILLHHNMWDWKVRLSPPLPDGNPRCGSGNIATGIKLIIIWLHTRHEMNATLYHEILHYEHPDWSEKQVEKQTRNVFPQQPVSMDSVV